jgi:hypothetical protein
VFPLDCRLRTDYGGSHLQRTPIFQCGKWRSRQKLRRRRAFPRRSGRSLRSREIIGAPTLRTHSCVPGPGGTPPLVAMPGGEPLTLRVFAERPDESGCGAHECARHELPSRPRAGNSLTASDAHGSVSEVQPAGNQPAGRQGPARPGLTRFGPCPIAGAFHPQKGQSRSDWWV